MHREVLQAGLHHTMNMYWARGPETYARKALGDATDYIFAGIWWSKNLPYPQVKKFVDDYKGFTGREPDSWYAATAYEAVRGLAAAIEKGGALKKTTIRDELRKIDLRESLLRGQALLFGSG